MKDYNSFMPNQTVTQNKKQTNGTKKKKKSNKLSKVFGIVLLCAAIVIFANIGKDLANVISLNKQAKEVEAELEELKAENAELLSTKEKFEDPNYVTTYAKGEYMFSNGDEKLFRLPSKSE